MRKDMKKMIKAVGMGVYFTLWAFVFAIVALCSCENQQKPICGYIVGKECLPHHSVVHHDVVLQRTTTYLYPDMWFVYVADSTGVRKVRVDKYDYENARKGQFARYKTDGSTQTNE